MENINVLQTILIVLVSVFSVIGGIWGFFKIFFSYRSRFLFITNCQILHRSIWKDISKRYTIKQNGPQDHAFRPLVLLPHTLRKYSNIPNGAKAILECINPDKENNLKIIAEVYWIPDDMKPWNTINHPVFSLVLRRYFGIERPLYQDEDTAKGNWVKVSHSLEHLDPLHRRDELDGSMMHWAVNNNITFRYFNPWATEKEDKYTREPRKNNFIEYCGLSMVLRKRSIHLIEKE
jgi:hypothetical protein